MSEHASALEAAMKAGGFDPLNHVARKAVEDAVAAYLSERGGEPSGYLFELFYPGSDRWSGQMFSDHDPGKNLPAEHIRNVVPLFAVPPAEGPAPLPHVVRSQEITDFLYKHGDLTYSAAARAVQLLAGNGYGFTSSSEERQDNLLRLRKALRKIADMIDAEDADLDDAISIASTALASEDNR